MLLVASLILHPHSPLTLQISEPPRKLIVGSQWKSRFFFANKSGSDIRIVAANGTEYAQVRPPKLTVFIQRRGSWPWSRLTSPPICGNSNPIGPEEFRSLAKGKQLEGQIYFSWSAKIVGNAAIVPGRYLLKVVYDTTAPIDDWIGGPLPEPNHSQVRESIRPLFNQVPKGVFESKPVEFEVAAPKSGSTSAQGR